MDITVSDVLVKVEDQLARMARTRADLREQNGQLAAAYTAIAAAYDAEGQFGLSTAFTALAMAYRNFSS